MSVLNNLSFLPYIAHRGNVPVLPTRISTQYSVDQAKPIFDDYRRLHEESLRRKKFGRAVWVNAITLNDIIEWSGFEYWSILDGIQQNQNDKKLHIKTIDAFTSRYEQTDPNAVRRWMLHHCHRSIVHKSMPGFIAEYIRRFEKEDHIKNGYDKLLHCLWGAVLPTSIGKKAALGVSVTTELIEMIGPNAQDAMADHDAFCDGMKYIKQ